MDKAPTVSFVVVDGIRIDVDVHNVALEAILADMVEAEHKGYGAHIRVAAKFNDLMPFAWFDVEANETSDEAKALKPHKAALYVAFKAARHSNPSVPFGRIKEYGRNLRAGLAPNGKTLADGSALPNNVSPNGEGEGANPAKRSDTLFAIEESVRLWKRMNKSDDAKLTAYATDIAKAMKAHLGIDVRTIK